MSQYRLWRPAESNTGYETERPRHKSSRTVTQPDPRPTTKTESRQQSSRGYVSDSAHPSSSRAQPQSTHYNTVPSTSKSSRHYQQPSSSQYPTTSSYKATTSYAAQPASTNATSQTQYQRHADPPHDTRAHSSRQTSDRVAYASERPPTTDEQPKYSRHRTQTGPSTSHVPNGEPPSSSVLFHGDAPRRHKESVTERPKETARGTQRDIYAERAAEEQSKAERRERRRREKEREGRLQEESRGERHREKRREEELKYQQEQKVREARNGAEHTNYGRDRRTVEDATRRPYDATQPTMVAISRSARSKEPEDSDNSPRRKTETRSKSRQEQVTTFPSNVCSDAHRFFTTDTDTHSHFREMHIPVGSSTTANNNEQEVQRSPCRHSRRTPRELKM